MKFILTWETADTFYIRKYIDIYTALEEYKRLSFNSTVRTVWLDEYNENGKLIQNWIFTHN